MDKATETRREGAPTASKLNGQAMLAGFYTILSGSG